MVEYGMDLDKVLIEFDKAAKSGDLEQIFEFANEIIPKLINELKNT